MIVVTTPTGKIGRTLVGQLLDTGEAVRLVVRDPSKLTPKVRDRVQVVRGSQEDATVIDEALAGADAVFWLCPPAPAPTPAAATVGFSRAGAEAMRRHGVAHIVAATTLGRGTPWQERAGNAAGSIHMIDLLRKTGAAVRGLALPAFMDNALLQIGCIAQGKMTGPISANKKLPHVAADDVTVAAARLLVDRSWSDQEDIAVLGPEELSYAELAAIVGEVIGRDVKYERQSYETYKHAAMARGLNDAFAQGFVDMLRAKEEGMDNVASRTGAIIGSTSFRQWAERNLRPAMTS